MKAVTTRRSIAIVAALALVSVFARPMPVAADAGSRPTEGVAATGASTVTLAAQAPVTIDPTGYFRLEAIEGTFSTPGADFDLAPRLPECSDGVDNDGDGTIDYPDDPECASAADSSELLPRQQTKPRPVIAGTIDADGNVTVPSGVLSAPPVAPQGGIYFPWEFISAPGVRMDFELRPAPVAGSGSAPFTGRLDPVTGELDLQIALRLYVNFHTVLPAGSSCLLGNSLHRIIVDLTTGTTSPPLPNGPISGVPYRTNTGVVRLVNNSFALPAPGADNPPHGVHVGCSGLLGVVNQPVLIDTLGLPAPAGTNMLDLTFRSVPVFNESPNTAPVVDAGPGITGVLSGDTVELGATGLDDDGDPLWYSWSQVGGPEVSLVGWTTSNPTFTARKIGPDDVLTFEVTATDSVASATDTVTVTVDNQAPTADAGADQDATRHATVQLSAASSTDPDDEPLSYSWAQTDDEDALHITGATTATPSFVVPADAPLGTTYELTVTVDDASGGTDTDTVSVTVVNAAPVADAGADQKVAPGATVTLDATGSSDVDDDDLSYSWLQTGGPPVTLSDATSATPTFTAPARGTAVSFQLTASDGHLTSSDTVTVKVPLISEPGPVRFTITSGSIDAGRHTYALDGGVIAGTIDEDGTISVPAGTSTAPPAPGQEGIYLPTASLTVGANDATITWTTPNTTAGSVDPETGAVTLTLGLRPQVTGYGAANSCFLGGANPITITLDGTDYSTVTGISTLTNTTFAMENISTGASNCGNTTSRNAVGQAFAGRNNGSSDAGTNSITITSTSNPILNQVAPGTLAGTVTSGGEPIDGARVRYYAASSSALLGQVFTGPDGTYDLGALPAGDYKVRVTADGHSAQFWSGRTSFATADAVTVAPATTATADFALAATPTNGTVSGTVSGSGDGVAGATVRLYSTSAQIVATTSTGPDGTYTFTAQPGTYKVLVLDQSGDWVSPRWAGGTSFGTAAPFVVTAGGSTVDSDVELTPTATLASIAGTVTNGSDPAPGLRVALYNTDAEILATTYTDADGTYAFTLPAGTYLVRLREPSSHADTWWEGANRFRTATPITVTTGSPTTGIDLTATPLP